MSKYLKILLSLYLCLFYQSSILFSQDNSSNDSEESSSDEEDDEEAIDSITTPNLIPSSELSAVESSGIVQFLRNPNRGTLSLEAASVISNAGISADALNAIGSSGVASSEIIALGSSNLASLASKLTGTAAEQATQFKTLVNVVDAYSNVETDPAKLEEERLQPVLI